MQVAPFKHRNLGPTGTRGSAKHQALGALRSRGHREESSCRLGF